MTAFPGPLGDLRQSGYAFVPRQEALSELGLTGDPAHWGGFKGSWNDLGEDRHMADQGRYRRRRHGLLAAAADPDSGFERLPDAPHYQGLHYNRLNGGVQRQFDPVLESTLGSPAFEALFRYGRGLSCALRPGVLRWLVEVHQFRIEARAQEAGLPTPEGIHRDGVDFVLVALVDRHNIQSGTTTIHGPGGEELGAFTLAEPLDLALVDDQRVWHGVTAVEALDPQREAWRDVLVLTFKDQIAPPKA